MNETSRCPVCGADLPEGAPAGLCPRCLLQAGVAESKSPTTPYAGSTRFRAPTPAELAPRFPQLEILDLLGQGGMGAVYKARQPGLDRLVALKILPPEVAADPAFAERFSREARALAKLNHPNIVGVYDFGRTSAPVADSPGSPGALYYFLMEYVDGVNLREAIRRGNLQPAEALRIVPQVCDALQFAHDEGIVHRDIKPENILLDKRGRVKIADFGLAKLLGMKGDHHLTGTQQVMGTPHYMAPEQIQGTRDVDHRADIYSLGVTFYEMLTGELPLGRFAPPSKKVEIDVRLDEVVLRTLEREPEKRYQHASEVKTEVETISGVIPAALQRAFGMEYRSRATLFGFPLLHIAFGLDPKTGRSRRAKGIVALGDVAIGVVACGGLAMGGLTFGGASVGLVSFGGVALALGLAVGGVAIGSGAFGGLAIGGVALGGLALGYYAAGGTGWGVHALLSDQRDPAAVEFFDAWAGDWPRWLTWLGIGAPVLASALWGTVWCVFRFMTPQTPHGQGASSEAGSSITHESTEGVAFPRGRELEQAIAELLPEDKVAAVRLYREKTGAGLIEAVSAVKGVARRYKKDGPLPFSWEHFVGGLVWAAAAVAGGFWLAETQTRTANRLMFQLGGIVAALFAVATQISWQRRRSGWNLEDFED